MIKTLAAALVTSTCIVALATPAAAQTAEYKIPAGSLKVALDTYVRQSGRQVVYRADEVRSARSPGVRGSLTPEAALAALLSGSGFTTRVDGKLVAIVKEGNAPADTDNVVSSGEGGSANGNEGQEIVVVGTNIRGVAPVGSAYVTLSRDEIDKSGISTTDQLVQILPQNTGDQASFDGLLIPGPNGNASYGTGVNLFGLGSQGTLTLINGHRVPSAGIGKFVDISVIPLTAVERVDVLLDGASAIYGSDAVGGVVNFKLRRDYEGAETALRSGVSTEGGGEDIRASQVVGGHLGPVNALLSYEYYQQNNVDASQRDFVGTQQGLVDVVPKSRQHSLFGALSWDAGPRTALTIDGQYSWRRVDYNSFDIFSLAQTPRFAKTERFGGTIGLEQGIGEDWALNAFVQYGKGEINRDFLDPAATRPLQEINELFTAEAKLDGPLFDFGGGDVRLAMGGGTRWERSTYLSSCCDIDEARKIRYGYGELYVPFFGQENGRPGLRRLELTVAGRYERYSDFGDTTNPKIGIAWAPTNDLTFRGSYGRSFRAPGLDETISSDNSIFFFGLSNSSGGTTRSLVLFGSNPDLTPERARTWSAGFDFAPVNSPGLKLSGTYYNIRYTDRIQSVSASFNALLVDPVYSPLITLRNGPNDTAFDALVTNLIATIPTQFACALPLDANGHCTEPATNFLAVADQRLLNVSSVSTDGISGQLSYSKPVNGGVVRGSVNANYILHFKRQLTNASPTQETVNTLLNPLKFKSRATLGFDAPSWSVSTSLNYQNGYAETRAANATKIGSWTTFDLFGSVKIATDPGIELSLSVRNLFDQDPPATSSASTALYPLNYDPANADALGRFVSVEARIRW